MSLIRFLQCFIVIILLNFEGIFAQFRAPSRRSSSPQVGQGLYNAVAPVSGSVGKKRRNRNRFASEILEAHNKARIPIGQTPLKWDKGLALHAKLWAMRRQQDCSMEHSGSEIYGENMFFTKLHHWTPKNIVDEWVVERKDYNAETNTCAENKMCGHYTQIVWARTTRVGCGRVICDNKKGFLVVCNYDPPGNYEDQSPFDENPGEKTLIPPSETPIAEQPLPVIQVLPTERPILLPDSASMNSSSMVAAKCSTYRVSGGKVMSHCSGLDGNI